MPDKRLTLKAEPDFVLALTKCKPVRGLEELVWNALDADANSIEISLQRNALDGLESIKVSDNGHGIPFTHQAKAFGQLGGSTKTLGPGRSPRGRPFHGHEGKGRLRALSLGKRVLWTTRHRLQADEACRQWTATASSHTPRVVATTEAIELDTDAQPGTEVLIEDLNEGASALLNQQSGEELLARLAVYLRTFGPISIKYDGRVLDEESVVERTTSYEDDQAQIIIVEWKREASRKLYLCTSEGMARHELSTGIQAKGYRFTAYLRSTIFDRMTEADLAISELRPDIAGVIDSAREKIRDHFRARDRGRAAALIGRWRAEGIYPYADGAPSSPIEAAEREVFDICAVNISERLPGFDKGDPANKRLTMALVRQALETSPSSLQSILKEVLNLNQEQREDLAALLQRTRLSSIISAARVISDRLTFLGALEDLVFNAAAKKLLLERSQLHRILVSELWIFGESYLLGHDDRNLRNLLNSHAKLLGRPAITEEVLSISGEEQLPDLMLYQQVPLRGPAEFEHLVVELKRPSVNIGRKEIDQIEGYALTVSKDPRFDKARTKWRFIVISTGLSDLAEEKSNQTDREWGHIIRKEGLDVFITTWAKVIQAAKWRYEFYRKQLQVAVSEQDTRAYLAQKHQKYVTKEILDAIAPSPPPPHEDMHDGVGHV